MELMLEGVPPAWICVAAVGAVVGVLGMLERFAALLRWMEGER